MPKIVYTLEAVNERLFAKGSKVRLVARGRALGLRAMLPPKPLAGRIKAHRQRIPLNITCPVPADADTPAIKKAREAALKKAEAEAEILNTAILYNRFSWDDYNVRGTVQGTPTSEIIANFKTHYMQHNTLKERTWERNWWRCFQYLPQSEPLTEAALMTAIATRTKPNTETRRRAAKYFLRLAEFANVPLDISKFLNDTRSDQAERGLLVPTDDVILAHRPAVTGRYRDSERRWQWLFSMLFVAGLRPHEVFFCEWTDEGLQVLKGKTGPRLILTQIMELMSPGLVERWDLKTMKHPRIANAEALYEKGTLGNRISNHWYKKQMPITAYSLRHAFALRGVKCGVPTRTMASMMGHSEREHTDTYRKWLSKDHNKEILDNLLKAKNQGN